MRRRRESPGFGVHNPTKHDHRTTEPSPKKVLTIAISNYYAGIESKDICARCGGYAKDHYVRIYRGRVVTYIKTADACDYWKDVK